MWSLIFVNIRLPAQELSNELHSFLFLGLKLIKVLLHLSDICVGAFAEDSH